VHLLPSCTCSCILVSLNPQKSVVDQSESGIVQIHYDMQLKQGLGNIKKGGLILSSTFDFAVF
jgi:hypothetical protein